MGFRSGCELGQIQRSLSAESVDPHTNLSLLVGLTSLQERLTIDPIVASFGLGTRYEYGRIGLTPSLP